MRVAVIGLAALALCGGAYAAALETSVFAVRHIVIVGGSSTVQRELRVALEPEVGHSLLRVNSGAVDRLVAPIPDIVRVSYDRQFPNTLKVRITAERPVMLLRRASGTWLVSARGRVMRKLRTPGLSSLPRLYVPKATPVKVGETLPARAGGAAAAAAAALARSTFPSPVRFIASTSSELTYKLRSRFEIRLGDLGDLHLKIAIARRILKVVGAGPTTAGYLDVSVPERPVISKH